VLRETQAVEDTGGTALSCGRTHLQQKEVGSMGSERELYTDITP
jgi:hypothetical protein